MRASADGTPASWRLVRRLQPGQPYPVTLEVRRAKLGQALGGDFVHPAEEVGGEVGGRRDPARVLPEEDARHRLEHGPEGGEPVAWHLGDRDEVVGADTRRVEGGRHRRRIGAELLVEDGLDLVQVLDAPGLEPDEDDVGRRHQRRPPGADDRGPGRPGDVELEAAIGPQVGMEGGVVPGDAPGLVGSADQAEVTVIGQVADPGQLEVGVVGGELLVVVVVGRALDGQRSEGGRGEAQVVAHGGDRLRQAGRRPVHHRRHGRRVEALPGGQVARHLGCRQCRLIVLAEEDDPARTKEQHDDDGADNDQLPPQGHPSCPTPGPPPGTKVLSSVAEPTDRLADELAALSARTFCARKTTSERAFRTQSCQRPTDGRRRSCAAPWRRACQDYRVEFDKYEPERIT